MTDDLVKRLRRGTIGDKERHEAADYIAKLVAGEIEFDRVIGDYASENALFRDRIAKLEAALREIVDLSKGMSYLLGFTPADIARKALEGKDD